MQHGGLDVLVIMTAFSEPQFARELCVVSHDPSLTGGTQPARFRSLMQPAAIVAHLLSMDLQLAVMALPHTSHPSFAQHNVVHSRKTVMPAVSAALTSLHPEPFRVM